MRQPLTPRLRAGMLFLGLASAAKFLSNRFGGDAMDLLVGILYGVSLGLLLLGLRDRRASNCRE
ncbi:MAG: hypothetical protein R2729_07420 [Bryobacteraceae bacterium]